MDMAFNSRFVRIRDWLFHLSNVPAYPQREKGAGKIYRLHSFEELDARPLGDRNGNISLPSGNERRGNAPG